MKASFISYLLLFLFLVALPSGHAGENKWTALGPNGGSFVSFAFHPAKDNLIFASSKNGLFRSVNSGKSWKRLEISGDSLVVRIHPRNPSAIIASREEFLKANEKAENFLTSVFSASLR